MCLVGISSDFGEIIRPWSDKWVARPREKVVEKVIEEDKMRTSSR
jgi:hypothetical protein